MTDYKSILGLITIFIGIISYSFYFRDIYRGKTKPEAFSWLIWGILASITYFVQSSSNGGPGAWATLITAIACLTISGIAFYKKSNKFKLTDALSLFGAALALALWTLTSEPLLTVLLVIFVGAIGFVPMFLQVYANAQEETLITFLLNASKFFVALFALESFNPVNWLYPVAFVILNVGLSLLIIWRRR